MRTPAVLPSPGPDTASAASQRLGSHLLLDPYTASELAHHLHRSALYGGGGNQQWRSSASDGVVLMREEGREGGGDLEDALPILGHSAAGPRGRD